MPHELPYARVAVARPLTEPLTYAVPALLADELALGHVVLVPLGRGQETGYVVERTATVDFDVEKLKPVTRLLDPEPAFDAAQLAFFEWVARYYMAPLGEVIRTALPSRMQARQIRVLEPTDEGVEAITAAEVDGELGLVLREVISRPGRTRKGLARRLAAEVDKDAVKRATDTLVRRGLAAWSDKDVKEAQATVATAALAAPLADAAARVGRMGKRMRAVLDALDRAGGPVDVAVIVAEQGASARDALGRLADAGAVVFGEREDRDALVDAPPLGSRVAPPPNPAQRRALDALCAPDAHGAFLLYGVTGSGKTEVFLGTARHALDQGRQVLVLVPEIGLTPQLVGRFKARFGDAVAVLHSGLSAGDRLRHWRRIRAGEAKVAVGARSALFAPFGALGLVVVDEEHDDSYKQDDGVHYNARDLAVVLGHRYRCPTVLASATPSLESWYNARIGKYTLLRLPERATPRPVPRVELVDLTHVEPGPDGKRPLLAPEVEQALRDTFANGGQAIVLYNRRGYATMVECTSCGGSYDCPNCGITMTLHRRANVVACHYCGLRRPYQDACPACGHATLEELGKGTERVEETLAALFPRVPMARMDADTTAGRGAHHDILQAFREGRTRLLVGTQIVAKGHDFPGVHTAVVVSADRGFRMPDFRAAERTFSLLVQMAGRAGRGDVAGRVLVQTYKPDHYALQHLDDPEGFYVAESRLRKTLRYPPFTRLCLVRLDGIDRRVVNEHARSLASDLKAFSAGYPGVDVLGPALAALPRLVGRWRFQVVLRGSDSRAFRAYLRRIAPELAATRYGGVRVGVDVDPRHLL